MRFLFAVCALFGLLFSTLAFADSGNLLDLTITLMEKLPVWVNAITGLVTAATAITALTPSRSDDIFLDKVLKVLNFIAGNFLKNKNYDDKMF